MPPLEQCFDWYKPQHSVIIARSRPVCTRTMFRDLQTKYDLVTAVIRYDSVEDLVAGLEPAVITPALAVHDRLLERKAQKLHSQNIRDLLASP